MNWYKKAQPNRFLGFKMVAWNGERAYSLYEQSQTIDLTIGSEIQMGGNGIYLGTSKEFCKNYYSGLTDDQDMLLTYSYGSENIISGDPNHPNSEIQVNKARLTHYEIL